MELILSQIIKTIAIELLVPLVKELIVYIVNGSTKGTGITDDDFNEISDLMSYSKLNKQNKI